MNRHSILIAVGVAAVVFGGVLSVSRFLVTDSDVAAPTHYGRILDLEDRLERLEDQHRERVEALEERLALLGDLRPREPARAVGRPARDEEQPDAASREASDEGSERELSQRVDDLERRVSGLEEDPVQRGYYFVESESPELRRQGILALERIAQHDEEARATIRQMLGDGDKGVRATAIDTLADIGDKASADAIMTLLADPEADVRAEAITALARLDAKQSGEAIASLLADEQTNIRQRAASALGSLRSPEGVDFLIKSLDDTSDRVRGEVINSLGRIRDPRALAPLQALYSGDPGGDRLRVAMALKGLGDETAFQTEFSRLSKTALSSDNENARRDAIRTLSWVARDEAKETFQQALQDPSARVRSEAQRALNPRGRR